MTLSLKVFGFEFATLSLDLPPQLPTEVTVVDKAAKGLTRWFTERMVK